MQELGTLLSEPKKQALKDKPINKQIEMTVTIMQELGYQAQLAQSQPDQIPMIDAYNCVFHDLAYENEEVCELDLSFLSSLLDSKIEHVCCMVKAGTGAGLKFCLLINMSSRRVTSSKYR